MPTDGDVEPAIARLDTGLFPDAGVGAVDTALLVIDAHAAAAEAHRHVDPRRLVPAFVLAGVLLTGQRQVAADVGDHRLALGLRAFQRGVAATDQRERVGRVHRGLGMGGAAAVTPAPGPAGAHVYADARLAADRHADLAAGCLVAFDLLAGFPLRLQQQVPRRRQGHVAAFHPAAGDGDIATVAFAIAGGVDHHVACAGDAAAAGRGGAVVHRTVAAAGTDADAQAQPAAAAAGAVAGIRDALAGLVAEVAQRVHAGTAAGEQRLSGTGHVQGGKPVVLHLAGTLHAAGHGHGGVHRPALETDVDARLPELLRLRDAGAVLCRLDRHVLPDDADARLAQHVAAGNAHVAAGHDVHPALGAADQAAAVRDLLDVGGGVQLLLADRKADPAAAEHPRLLHRPGVRLGVRVLAHADVDVAPGRQQHVAGADHLRRLRGDVPPRGDLHGLAADHRADGVAVAVGVVRGGGLAAEHAGLLLRLVHLQAVGLAGRGQGDVPARRQRDAAGVAHHRGRLQGQVVAGLQHDVAAGIEAAAAHRFAAGLHGAAVPACRLRAVVGGAVHHRAAVDVATGLQHQCIARLQLRGGQGHVLPGLQHHVARALHGGADVAHRAGAVVVAGIDGGVALFAGDQRAQVDVARRRDPGDAVHARIDDLRRLQRDVAPGIDGQHPQAAGVGDVQPGHPVDL